MVKLPHGYRRAFTLFELVLVTLIIGIIGLMVIPMIGSATSGPRLEIAADQLLADVEYCQSLNIARTDVQVAIRFDRDQNRYQLESMPAGATTPTTVIKFPGDSQPYINDFSTGRNQHLMGVSLGNLPGNATVYRLYFNRYGMPVGSDGKALSQHVQIPVIAGDRTIIITVKWDTGEVSITK